MEFNKSIGSWKLKDLTKDYLNIFVYVIASNGLTWSSADINPAIRINLYPDTNCNLEELTLNEFKHQSTI